MLRLNGTSRERSREFSFSFRPVFELSHSTFSKRRIVAQVVTIQDVADVIQRVPGEHGNLGLDRTSESQTRDRGAAKVVER